MINANVLKYIVVGVTLLAIAASAIGSIVDSTHGYTINVVNVEGSDLDLSKRSDLLSFYLRVQDAALLSCDPTGESRLLPYYDQPESGNCYIDTFNASLVTIDSQPLIRLHDELKHAPGFVY